MEYTKNLLQMVLQTNNDLGQVQDVDILLDRILSAARAYTCADAGTIYLIENNQLTARFVQNDTLRSRDPLLSRLPVQSASFPINQNTISGYVASTGKIVLIKDAYNLPSHLPFKFTSLFDKSTNYHSESMLVVPINSTQNNIIGIIQVINKLNAQKKIVSFDKEDTTTLAQFASTASIAIQRASFIRNMVLRMIKMIELHDPDETPHHVSHVAECAAELYNCWAVKNNIESTEREFNRDKFRLAAMLHDIGKIAIPNNILHRQHNNSLLSPVEQDEMESHTWKGALLFEKTHSSIDTMIRTISLTHHEKWDGTGYPGYVDIKNGKPLKTDSNGAPLRRKGTEIPLSGRIVAIADAYDITYSRNQNESEALETITSGSNTFFDPELCDLFQKAMPSIKDIYKYYASQAFAI